MMQLLLYQINWSTILDLESVGSGPSSNPILLLFWGNFLCFSSGVFKILESDLFQENFTTALYFFGGVNDLDGVPRHGLCKIQQECLLCCLVFVAMATLIAIKLNFHLYIIQLW